MSHSYQTEWWDLKKHAIMKLESTRHAQVPPSSDWDPLLMRFRKLREALTAAGAPAELRQEVYEASADVCAAAGNMAELLKCLQQLMNNIYPALARQQQQQQQPHAVPRQQQTPHTDYQQEQQQQQQQSHRQHLCHLKEMQVWSEDEDVGAAVTTSSSGSGCERRPEVAAALLLYFVCVPQQPVIQEITKQLRAAARTKTYLQGAAFEQEAAAAAGAALLAQHPVYQRAVADTAAALRCNWCRFLQSFHQGQPKLPVLVHAVMRQHVDRIRVQAICKLGIAYRMLPTEALQRWLWLQQGSSRSSGEETAEVDFQQVVSLLQQAAAGGASRAASIAAAQCVELTSLPPTLQFRQQQV